MSEANNSMSLANPHPPIFDLKEKMALGLAAIGGLILLIAFSRIGGSQSPLTLFLLSITLMTVGGIWFSRLRYTRSPEGIKNNGVFFHSLTNRGLWGWIFGIILTGFYILLYWYPTVLGLGVGGAANTGIVALFDPLSMLFKGQVASQWFMYGTLYTVAILVMGFKFINKYRHNNYQIIRTLSVMMFQLFFAFLIPEILEGLNSDLSTKWFDKDLKNMWPLDYDFFDQWHIDNLSASGWIGMVSLAAGLLLIFVVSPFLTYKFGKRWYCSWVCGCGGLAETAGDPWRQLSDKSLNSWKIERWLIHSVLAFSVIMTIAVIYSYLGNDPGQYYITKTHFTWIVVTLLVVVGAIIYYLMNRNSHDKSSMVRYLIVGIALLIGAVFLMNALSANSNAFFVENYQLKKWYGLFIGAAFSGVVGVGFYPLLGSRVWCRFGCPMAAILGIQQKLFSRFRITTNGGQCISCGNCSTYCEMGIDVRSYAQKGQNIVRASCVGCGICAAVCPRGVLRLENGSSDVFNKTDEMRTIHISENEVKLMQ